MSYSRFVQICVAFQQESGRNQEQDEFHQLRNAINHLSKGVKHTFIPGKEMPFDEGSIASKSNFNPVRQYNNRKPDFFILAKAFGGHNFIHHIDV